jgi:hypothetical protein
MENSFHCGEGKLFEPRSEPKTELNYQAFSLRDGGTYPWIYSGLGFKAEWKYGGLECLMLLNRLVTPMLVAGTKESRPKGMRNES